MLKYIETSIGYKEVPNETSLIIKINDFPTEESTKEDNLTKDKLLRLVKEAMEKNNISCVCIMGGDSNHKDVVKLAKEIKYFNKNIAIAWYSEARNLSAIIMSNLRWFNYLKIGTYNARLGGLESRTTNQKFYKVEHLDDSKHSNHLSDITSHFYENFLKYHRND